MIDKEKLQKGRMWAYAAGILISPLLSRGNL
jgi:hypothetical protein